MTANRYILTTNGGFMVLPSGAELYHHGVKGQKWGVRRYQNADGSLTPAGKKRAAKLSEKLDTTQQKAKSSYVNALAGAYVARKGETKSRRNLAKQAGINAMDRATSLDKKVAKYEKRLKDIGVDPKKDQELVAARKLAGEEYVKRSKGAITADWVGQTAVNAGAVFAQVALGSPYLFAAYTTPNKHKLRDSENSK